MWRNVAKRVSGSRVLANPVDSGLFKRNPVSRPLVGFSDIHSFCVKDGILGDNRGVSEAGLVRSRDLLSVSSKSLGGRNHGFLIECRSLATMAEAAASSTDAEEVTSSSLTSAASEIQQLLGQLVKEGVRESGTKPVNFEAEEASRKKVDTDIKKAPMLHLKRQQNSSHSNRMTPLKYATLKQRQIKMETEAWEKTTKEYQDFLADMCKQKLVPNLPYMKSLFIGWFEPFRDLIIEEQKLCKKSSNKIAHGPYFTQLPGDMMAVITMHKLMGLMMTEDGTGSARLITASLQIGDAIEQEIRIRRFLDKPKKKSKENNEDSSTTKQQEILRKIVKDSVKRHKLHTVRKIVKEHDETKPWGPANHAKVGSRLLHLLLQSALIQPPVNQSGDDAMDIRPAFRHIQRIATTDSQTSHDGPYGLIVCDPLILQGLEKTAAVHMVIPYIPMLVPPLNWTGYDKGGHFFLPSFIMRTRGAKQQRDALKRASKEQMRTVHKALNTLGNTKWRINQTVLNVVERIWSTGGCLADLVNREDMPLPEKPDTKDETLLKKWRWKLKSAKKENSERHSQRCDIELRLSVARKMKDEEGFYYPHNIDFRGRAYPMHPYLNHLGSDLCRGILEFADGRPLRKAGLQWLKIHLANVYAGGVDKLSYDGRITFAENHVEDIFDSADRPLEGKRWWLGAEDPFQCLAVCINLAEALRSSSPESTISHLPVHQDGSCNGLQHYAALGRDQLGAASVNLIAMDKPADVYSGIADRVHQIMHVDSEQDSTTYPGADYAKLLIDQVDRKMVKQTVMTSVYGVTFIGAREQIRKRLKERTFSDTIDDDLLFRASCYAARVTLTALREMFQAARDIMNWLGDCAKIIAKGNHAVTWTTPIGLPVVQPYRQIGKHLVKTSLQNLTLQRETEKVLPQRQRTAFAPNFVHSLDSSHMMMTAIACREEGLVFAGVHDSFWTHACDVDVMNRVLREKFVELYEAPILENLLDSFKKSFPSLEFPPLPNRGDFDLKDVLDSTYFFN